jgi:ABC-type dipeptide/oligopeptide/nickel transport system permease subunit
VAAQLVVLATLDLGGIILYVSGLSFLGLGIQPPTPEWGAMISDAARYFRSKPELMLYPGLMILLVVMSFNFLGDFLRDHLDPNNQRMASL